MLNCMQIIFRYYFYSSIIPFAASLFFFSCTLHGRDILILLPDRNPFP